MLQFLEIFGEEMCSEGKVTFLRPRNINLIRIIMLFPKQQDKFCLTLLKVEEEWQKLIDTVTEPIQVF